MEILRANLWDLHAKGEWIAITTNGFVKRNGQAVMGRGCAREAAQRFPHLPTELGKHLTHIGNVPAFFYRERLLTFPVKHSWWEEADPELIRASAINIAGLLIDSGIGQVFIPKPGCGNGKLSWTRDVEPIFDELNNSQLVIVDKP